MLVIDTTPWHRSRPIDEALKANPHLEIKRLPSYSPQLHAIEHFWKKLRHRATHNRFFESLSALKRSLRASLRYFQIVKKRIGKMIARYYFYCNGWSGERLRLHG